MPKPLSFPLALESSRVEAAEVDKFHVSIPDVTFRVLLDDSVRIGRPLLDQRLLLCRENVAELGRMRPQSIAAGALGPSSCVLARRIDRREKSGMSDSLCFRCF